MRGFPPFPILSSRFIKPIKQKCLHVLKLECDGPMFARFSKKAQSQVVSLQTADADDDHDTSPLDRERQLKDMLESNKTIMSQTMELLEADISSVMKVVVARNDTVKTRIHQNSAIMEKIRKASGDLGAMTSAARDNAKELAESVDELVVSTNEISGQIAETSRLTDHASTVAGDVESGIDQLKQAVQEIAQVTSVISDVARQTNLLALNATIEAARSGEAGKGFAVVANEVKNLSVETQRATDMIAEQIKTLQATAEITIDATQRITDVIEQLRPLFQSVTHSVQTQAEETGNISAAANRSAGFAEKVSQAAHSINASTDEAQDSNTLMDEAADNMMSVVGELKNRFIMLIRQAEVGDRRQHDRYPIQVDCGLQGNGKVAKGKTVDISLGGVLCDVGRDAAFQNGSRVEISLSGLPPLSGQVRATSSLGIHISFDTLDAKQRQAVLASITSLQEKNGTFIALAKEGAANVASALEDAIRGGSMTMADLFDTDYQPIPGTVPEQVTMRALDRLQTILPGIIDPMRTRDDRVAFCLAADRNGYIPVHNDIYSQPPRTPNCEENIAWNTANCRDKRLFDDRAGLCATRNTRPYLLQSYPRDMGNGTVIMMNECDAPIYVNGRHWGGYRIGYKL